MQEALARAQGREKIVAGDLWWVPDDILELGDFDRSKRTRHLDRPCVVLQGDDAAQNQTCPTVVVVPCSHNTSYQRPWEENLFVAETPLDDPSIVKVHLIQPVNRDDLILRGRRVGPIGQQALGRIRVHLLWNLGLVPNLPSL